MRNPFMTTSAVYVFGFLLLAGCSVETSFEVKKKDNDIPVSELAQVAAFCREHAGVRVYQKISTDRLRLDQGGCSNSVCMRLLAQDQVTFIEAEVEQRGDDHPYYLSSAPGPGKYRFSLSENGDPDCASFQKIRERNMSNSRGRVPLPVRVNQCVAAQAIEQFTAEYAYQIVRGELEGREDGEKIAFRRASEQIVHLESEEVIAEGIVYEVYLGTHGASYGMGIEGGGVGKLNCQGDSSFLGFLDRVIQPE